MAGVREQLSIPLVSLRFSKKQECRRNNGDSWDDPTRNLMQNSIVPHCQYVSLDHSRKRTFTLVTTLESTLIFPTHAIFFSPSASSCDNTAGQGDF